MRGSSTLGQLEHAAAALVQQFPALCPFDFLAARLAASSPGLPGLLGAAAGTLPSLGFPPPMHSWVMLAGRCSHAVECRFSSPDRCAFKLCVSTAGNGDLRWLVLQVTLRPPHAPALRLTRGSLTQHLLCELCRLQHLPASALWALRLVSPGAPGWVAEELRCGGGGGGGKGGGSKQ